MANPDKPWQFQAGKSGNPGGRPVNSMKSYVARKLAAMTDEEKELWLETHNISGIDMWKMGEGNPKQDSEVDNKVTMMNVIVPEQVAKAFDIDATHTETIGGDTEQV